MRACAPARPAHRRSTITYGTGMLVRGGLFYLPSTSVWSFFFCAHRMLCSVRAGPRGPPFAPYLQLPRPLFNYLPSFLRPHSIGGTGWCYVEEYDEMARCSELEQAPMRD
eukprot:2233083-Pleurochrysis_carterae.AAC.1